METSPFFLCGGDFSQKHLSSLFYCRKDINKKRTGWNEIEWKRPGELKGVKDPKFFVDGPSRFDVNQGGLGDCWFVAALANLTMKKELFSQVHYHIHFLADEILGYLE